MKTIGFDIVLFFNCRVKELLARVRGEKYFCNSIHGNGGQLTINSDMTLSCNSNDFDGKGIIGDLKQNTLKEILDGNIAGSMRARLAKGKLPLLNCSRCEQIVKAGKSEINRKLHEKICNDLRCIHIENTSNCNLRYLACDRKVLKEVRKSAQMSLDDIRKISSLIKEHNIKEVSFFGLGEPFFSKRIKEEVEILRYDNPDLRIIASTNGELLDSHEKREAALMMKKVFFTITGFSRESAEKYQRNIDFEKAYDNMKKFVEFRNTRNKKTPIVIWKYFLFRWNDSISDLSKTKELAKQAGVDILIFHYSITPLSGISVTYLLKGLKHFFLNGFKLASFRAGDKIYFNKIKE